MLIEFSVGNYRSFKDVVTLSMVAADEATGNDELDKNNVFKVNQNFSLLKSAAIYGANASGKSNLILALYFMQSFVINSSKLQITDKIDLEKFRLSSETEDKPSFFKIVFHLDNKTYEYSFEVTQERVISEGLSCTPKTRKTNIFSREKDKIKYSKSLMKGKDVKDLTKKNTLFLSIAAQFNDPLAGKILLWFSRLKIISGSQLENLRQLSIDYLSREQNLKNEIVSLIKKLDLSIKDMSIEVGRKPLDNFHKDIPDTVYNSIETYHEKYDLEGKVIGLESFQLNKHESRGTQKLFALLAPILSVLKASEVLIIDELDSLLHPLMAIAIIGLFNSQQTNPKNAQLIFATHDVNLLSNQLFRRDQIWFTEKNRQEATDLYSLVEFDIDNNASFEQDYIQGRYGAIPFIGDLSKVIGDYYG
ncbi:MAG: ATP-binding protein [Microcystis panniformis Mp_MB_F_20051200_S9]|uniref:ATP-binding protein n=1 Tax=Microcystis panniformis Mp_MB_F_20051200_S9 TaxID=2486223 RepID=A0A552PYH6_9CHRO|nr:MAG: ATP-binding protein [Microcystis panniformis Mp_GB_SS_20050300_S99]TRV43400.1 MAG: ATP-binding protein [Microcystis panniformis Mp_GB_SS_20050300_S99D]TRV48655.1 MAG: ATP-binding protein [Microcystis panniformis Mp_MB_F_20080800_S26D]TRV54218.1 MAG: ATP-binding protein [Microcystis panniformis Mp_MB_F_20080800_S26]TRV61986.1 MAG: ATP-binding protein [Microcystis panniformis Mp_MB_F_20051200_S9]TRV69259.1 MAG: ATP-binding protein [Microcystis panniformis Mp_MB_F_20051200_S9D]TRV70154.1